MNCFFTKCAPALSAPNLTLSAPDLNPNSLYLSLASHNALRCDLSPSSHLSPHLRPPRAPSPSPPSSPSLSLPSTVIPRFCPASTVAQSTSSLVLTSAAFLASSPSTASSHHPCLRRIRPPSTSPPSTTPRPRLASRPSSSRRSGRRNLLIALTQAIHQVFF